MVTRIVKNTGTPFKDPAGNNIAGVVVSFRLVNAAGRPTEMITATGEWVGAHKVSVESDVNGEFSVSLPVTDQAVTPVFWMVEIDYEVEGVKSFRPFVAELNDGLTDATLSQMRAGTT